MTKHNTDLDLEALFNALCDQLEPKEPEPDPHIYTKGIFFRDNPHADYELHGNKWDTMLLEKISSEVINKYIRQLNMTVSDIAKFLGIERTTLIANMNGKYKYMRSDILDKLSDLLKVPVYRMTQADRRLIRELKVISEPKFFWRYNKNDTYRVDDTTNQDRSGLYRFICDELRDFTMYYSFQSITTGRIINITSDEIDAGKIQIERINDK